MKLAFFNLNKLESFVSQVYKDVLPKKSNKNVIYKIECKNCNAIYVEQIDRKLKIENENP